MNKRLELHNILINILGTQDQTESRVYFQPPSTVDMKYPCIVYGRSNNQISHADDSPYIKSMAYSVTVIDANPDSTIPGKISDLPTANFDRHYTADNLNHDAYNIFY